MARGRKDFMWRFVVEYCVLVFIMSRPTFVVLKDLNAAVSHSLAAAAVHLFFSLLYWFFYTFFLEVERIDFSFLSCPNVIYFNLQHLFCFPSCGIIVQYNQEVSDCFLQSTIYVFTLQFQFQS